MKRFSLSTHAAFSIVALLAAAGCAGAGSGRPPMVDSQRSDASHAQSQAFSYGVHPKVRRLSDLLLHNCPGGTTCALTPTTLRTAYNFVYQAGVEDGTGQTIVIVDAFGSPTIASDLTTFDKTVANLPDPPSFKILYSGGKPSINLNNSAQLGWAEETTLDVEWAHASAPLANIILVVANNDQGTTIQAAQQFAIDAAPAGSILSLSFGVQEAAINGGANNTQLTTAHAVYQQAASTLNDTVIASAGSRIERRVRARESPISGVRPARAQRRRHESYPLQQRQVPQRSSMERSCGLHCAVRSYGRCPELDLAAVRE